MTDEEAIRRIVEAAPPLTAKQLDVIVTRLQPAERKKEAMSR